MNRDEIMDQAGAENWKMIEDSFGGDTLEEVKATLDEMFLEDDNTELANAIFEALN